MKQLLTIILALFVFSTISEAQLYPIFGSYTFLEFVDAQSGWTGDAKRLLHTSDGGETWEVQLNFEPNGNMNLDHTIMSIHFVNNQIGILNVVDNTDFSTYIFRTEDGGSNWVKYAINNEDFTIGNVMLPIKIIDALNGFGIVSGKLFSTVDGGKTWQKIYQDEYIRKIAFVTNEFGYATTATNKLLKTTDGGAIWTEISFDGSPYFLTIDAIGSKVWVSDQWTGLYFSEDGGTNWSLISNFAVSDLNMIDEYFGISQVYVTIDGGVTWEEKFTANISSFIDTNLGWIISPNNGIYAVEHIKKVTNDFQTYETQTPSNGFTDVVTVNESIIVATTSNGEIVRSTNGGKTWGMNNDFSGYKITDLCFNDANDGVIVGNYFDSYDRWFIANSSDAGENWEIVMRDTSAYGNTLHALDYATGSFRAVNPWQLLVSHDLGKSWREYSVSGLPSSIIGKIIFSDDDIGFTNFLYLGSYYIYKTIDGGQNWSLSYEGTSRDIAFSSSNIGWNASGSGFGVVKTMNQGDSWNEIEIGAERIYFMNPMFGVFSGQLNYNDFQLGTGTFKTGNGGDAWEKISDIVFRGSERGSGIDYASENLGFFAFGDDMYSTTKFGNITDGTVSVDENNTFQPTEYSLSQNYPNPFNPSTVIEFSIPVSGNVSLKVYNTLGEEVAELLNNEMVVGYHSFNFNASNLSSGIYFYRISSGNFVQTNKMLLLR